MHKIEGKRHPKEEKEMKLSQGGCVSFSYYSLSLSNERSDIFCFLFFFLATYSVTVDSLFTVH